MSEFDIDTDFDLDADFSLDGEKDALEGVATTGDVEVDSLAEVSAVLKAFKERNAQEKKDKVAALDSEYWFCVCFQTRDQKEAFLKAVDWFAHGDKYLDGKFVAKKLGVKLPEANIIFHDREEKRSYTGEIPVIRDIRNRKGVK